MKSTLVTDIQAVLLEMKAVVPVVLDLTRYKTYCDYMVIATGTSDRHVRAMCDRIREVLGEKRQRLPLGVEGEKTAEWVLMDYGEVVVHLFQEEARGYYDLEGMWNSL